MEDLKVKHEGRKLKEQRQLMQEIISILQEKYGYGSEQIATEASIRSDSKRRADLVVFDEKQVPLIIVAVNMNRVILPISEFELKEQLLHANAKYGLLYNGLETRAYKLSGDNLIPIREIPKKKSLSNKYTKSQDIPTFTERNIWQIADEVRSTFYDYGPLLQILALKILDEFKFNRTLFKKFNDKLHEKNYISQLMETGKDEFPSLFSSDFFQHDARTNKKFILLLQGLWDYSIRKLDKDSLTRVIFRLVNHRHMNSVRIPPELSLFMFNLLEIPKDKKMLVFSDGQDYIFQISKFFIRNLKLSESNRKKYLKKNLAVIEKDSRIADIIKLISILRTEPFQVYVKSFLKADESFVQSFEFFLGMPPMGDIVHKEEVENNIGSYYGRQLINYVIMKIRESQSNKSKAAFLVPLGFLYYQNSDLVRRAILEPGYLKGVFQMPPGLLLPHIPIPTAIILMDFEHDIKDSEVFVSKIPELDYTGQKLNSKILNNIVINFRKFKNGRSFKESEFGFILPRSKLLDSWTVTDKTPEIRRVTEVPYATKLGNIGNIFYGKPGITELDSKKKTRSVPFLRISDLQDGLINSEIEKSVTISDDSRYEDVLVQENDIIISCQGTIGKVALAEKKDVGILPSPQIAIIRPNVKKILPEFLIQSLNSEKIQLQLRQKSKGDFILRLKKDDLLNTIVGNPPISVQQKIVSTFRIQKKKIEMIEKQLRQAKKDLLRFNFIG